MWRFHDIARTELYYIISIPIQTICTILSFHFGIKLLIQLCAKPQLSIHKQSTVQSKKGMNRHHKNIKILCCITCILCLFSDLLHTTYCLISETYLFGRYIHNIQSIADFWYYIATNSFYIIAFLRLHVTFKDTRKVVFSTKNSLLLVIRKMCTQHI